MTLSQYKRLSLRDAILGILCAVMPVTMTPSHVQAQGGPPPAAVLVDAVVESSTSGTTPILGRIVSESGGVIAAQVTGPVDQILVKVGDQVAQGDVLATLDRRRLELGVALAEAEWQTATANVTAARARFDQANLALRRLTGLKGSSAFSQARFEDAETDVVRTRSEIASAEAEASRMKANYDLAQLDLERSDIRAPYDGIITARQAEPGLYATPGTPIVTMIDTSSLEVEANVPFNRLAGLNIGSTVAVIFDDGSTDQAVVRAVIPEENPRTRTRLVRFTLAQEPKTNGTAAAINASVTVAVPNSADRNALTVHKDGVVQSPAGAFAYVAMPQEDGPPLAERRDIVIGDAIGNRFIVEDGLALDELVVIRGNERLRPNQALQLPSEG